MNKAKLDIIPCIPIGDKFPLNYYQEYYKYQKELRQIDKTIQNDPIESEHDCIEHTNDCINYINNLIYSNGQIAGLINYQVVDFCYDDPEWFGQPILIYIDHFYIKPEFRNKGIGNAVFNKLTHKYNDAVFYFYVLKNNYNAILFWDKVITKNKMKIIEDHRCRNSGEEELLKEGIKYIIRKEKYVI